MVTVSFMKTSMRWAMPGQLKPITKQAPNPPRPWPRARPARPSVSAQALPSKPRRSVLQPGRQIRSTASPPAANSPARAYASASCDAKVFPIRTKASGRFWRSMSMPAGKPSIKPFMSCSTSLWAGDVAARRASLATHMPPTPDPAPYEQDGHERVGQDMASTCHHAKVPQHQRNQARQIRPAPHARPTPPPWPTVESIGCSLRP